MSENIFKIKSKYILQKIFAHLDYKTVLKITKCNKSIRKKLGLNLDLFQEWSSYKYYQYYEIDKKNKKYKKFDIGREASDRMIIKIEYCCSGLCTLLVVIYVLIIASILAAKGAFNEKNTKNNYNKNYSKIVDKINYSLFGLLGYIIIHIIVLIFKLNDIYCKEIITKIILIFSGIIFIFNEVLIIVKLYFSYRIKKKVTWFMICDYILIIFIFFSIILLILSIFAYFAEIKLDKMREQRNKDVGKKKLVLTKFRGIEISEFELPEYFDTLSNNDKKKFILKNKNYYKIDISGYNKNLIFLINKFRKENNIDELIFDKIIFYKDLIIDNYTEPIFEANKNIFKLSDTNYLFKFPVGVFIKIFKERKMNINNILLKDNLKKIIIIIKDNFEYINLFTPKKKRKDIYNDIHIKLPSECFKMNNNIYSEYKYFDDNYNLTK